MLEAVCLIRKRSPRGWHEASATFKSEELIVVWFEFGWV